MADGRIWACDRDLPFDQRRCVSASLGLLIRALGTLVLTESVTDEAALSTEMAKATGAVGSEAFWLDLVRGHG